MRFVETRPTSAASAQQLPLFRPFLRPPVVGHLAQTLGGCILDSPQKRCSIWGTIIDLSPAFLPQAMVGGAALVGISMLALAAKRLDPRVRVLCDAKLHRPVLYQHVRAHAHCGHEHVCHGTLVAYCWS